MHVFLRPEEEGVNEPFGKMAYDLFFLAHTFCIFIYILLINILIIVILLNYYKYDMENRWNIFLLAKKKRIPFEAPS